MCWYVSLSIVYASAELAHMVSPPKGGTCTDLRLVIDGGSARNGESVCQPSPNTIFEGSFASLISG